eukprot:1264593-Rhodomonas_salina.5
MPMMPSGGVLTWRAVRAASVTRWPPHSESRETIWDSLSAMQGTLCPVTVRFKTMRVGVTSTDDDE